MLDTETGSPAETVYPNLGYTQVCIRPTFVDEIFLTMGQLGIIPKYGVSPVDGSLIAGTFFWKQL